MSGEFIGKVEDFEPPKPHICEPPSRMNYAKGYRESEGTSGQLWRCDCGKAWRCVIETDQRDHDSWTTWKRYERADNFGFPVHAPKSCAVEPEA